MMKILAFAGANLTPFCQSFISKEEEDFFWEKREVFPTLVQSTFNLAKKKS